MSNISNEDAKRLAKSLSMTDACIVLAHTLANCMVEITDNLHDDDDKRITFDLVVDTAMDHLSHIIPDMSQGDIWEADENSTEPRFNQMMKFLVTTALKRNTEYRMLDIGVPLKS